MSKKLFSNEDIEMLSKNKYVRNVSNKEITYTDKFERLFIAKNEKGEIPREIFAQCSFDIKMIGLERIRSSCNRWRSRYYKYFSSSTIEKRKSNAARNLESKDSILKAYNFKSRKKGTSQIKITLNNHFGINYNLKRIRRIMKKIN